MSPQGPGLRTPPVVVSGGVITVEVGTSAQTVEVSTGAPGETTSHPVGPDRVARIPVPPVPGGTVLAISVGRGLRASIVLVEVIAP